MSKSKKVKPAAAPEIKKVRRVCLVEEGLDRWLQAEAAKRGSITVPTMMVIILGVVKAQEENGTKVITI